MFNGVCFTKIMWIYFVIHSVIMPHYICFRFGYSMNILFSWFFFHFFFFPKRWPPSDEATPRPTNPPPACCSCLFPVSAPTMPMPAPATSLFFPALKGQEKNILWILVTVKSRVNKSGFWVCLYMRCASKRDVVLLACYIKSLSEKKGKKGWVRLK